MSNKIKEQDIMKCKICSKNASKYKCPKCYVDYCSVDCFKSSEHSQCSENFYRQCFMEVLKDKGVDEESKKEFQKMLRKVQDQSGMTNDVEGELKEPEFVNDMDGETKKLWNSLSCEEKKSFCEIHDRGDFSAIIDLWEPWWMQNEAPLIDDESRIKELMKKIPELYSEASPDLNGRTLSDKLGFIVVNVIYGYAYAMRLYNGDCTDMPLEFAQTVQSIAGGLGDEVFVDVSQAVSQCIMSLNAGKPAEDFFVSREFSLGVIKDVIHIVEGPNCFRPTLFIEACLSHCVKIFDKGLKLLQRERNKKGTKNSSNMIEDWHKMFFKARKKLEFLISWTSKLGKVVSSFNLNLEDEFHKQLSLLAQAERDKKAFKKVMKESKTRPQIVML